jgi:4-hydroxythreonine-4-phosphate dehydrogenase
MNELPRLLLTMGDVAGIGPELLAKAWPELLPLCRPAVVGDPGWLTRALALAESNARVQVIQRPAEAAATTGVVPCLVPSTQDLRAVVPGRITGAAGRAAYDFLCAAIDWTTNGAADGIVTCPLHKEGLHAAGIPHPGHTEILAERTGTREFGMMLYGRGPQLPQGLGVVHVTLHMPLREVFEHVTTAAVLEKVQLIDRVLRRLVNGQPRIAVAALNPHSSDGGLFGDEEARLLQPAVERGRDEGLDVSGPWPCDTLFVRAQRGEFDGIVAMYHDQGHIAMKLLGGNYAVNVSLGLPIVRTSVAHGTAYDIAGRGVADHRGLIEATRLAALLARKK